MNIDDLNPQNTGTPEVPGVQVPNQAPVQSVPDTPFVQPAPAPMPEPTLVIEDPSAVVSPEPAPIPVMEAPVVQPQADIPVMESVPVVETPAPAAEVQTPTVDPAQSGEMVAPVPIPEQKTEPANNFGELPPLPGQTTVGNSELPPLPGQSVAPVNNQEVTVVNTTKKRSSSNIILVILALALVLFVVNIDAVMAFVNENIIKTNPISTDVPENNNLVDGFIKINDGNSDYRIKEIRFYNFKKSGNNTLLINYSSNKNYNDVKGLNLFVEIYNSNKELLTKQQFEADAVVNNEARPFLITVDDTIYSYAYYAKVVEYTDSERNATSKLTCTFSDSNENYLLEYKTIYNFTNNELTGYEVSKKVEAINNNKATTNAVNVIKKEHTDVTRYEVAATFENNVLNYKIDLNNVNEGYIPFYSKGTTPTIIKEKETAKKWICE